MRQLHTKQAVTAHPPSGISRSPGYSGAPARREGSRFAWLQLLVLLAAFVSVSYLLAFSAEDAFITYRYAENLVQRGALIYNTGEPINAMTSPLHAILSAGLFWVTGQTVISNKLFGLAMLVVSAGLVWRRYGGRPDLQALTLALLLLPPSVLLWTVGGLETPLLLFLVTVTVLLADRLQPKRLVSLCAICVLAGLAVLARYDASLFLLPVVGHVILQGRSVARATVALTAGAVLPLAWLTISVFYYGDLLPTSFYVKTPNGSLGTWVYNSQYIVAYLVLVGLVPVLIFAARYLQRDRRMLSALRSHLAGYWWLYLGLGLELLYGLSMATHHMMFSFRFFVPYMPVAVMLAVDLLRSASEAPVMGQPPVQRAVAVSGLLVGLTLFQGIQTAYTYNFSVNGLAPIGEYRSLGVRDYIGFIAVLKAEALDIQRHWAQVRGGEARYPRILTYAAGALPYTFRDAYIYEKLVSYRHCFERHEQGRYADYIHLLAPRQGTIEQQLPGPEDQYLLVSAYEIRFDGSPQTLLVYYNPEPEAHNLSAHIADPCQSQAVTATE